ncbi:uncharacterized protein LOC123664925 [Melitaea cinxia]|uniref:uncharacterized protein LOC123664925 n=1 Tax=Melitaea cinxia TaxID=113334 RepID=UPI001E26F94B|nr:uncharacterized protein LOC123664925 [Melitaea cinxia]
MSTTVKCVSCNIVINEVLAFICNKMDIMDEESISRICVTAFSQNDIVTAKRLLYESLSKQIKIRKRDGKTVRDIDDILCTLKEADPEVLPIFVARELQKLPPVLFDHVDVTQILKDLVKMRQDLNNVSQYYASKEDLNILKHDIETLKGASVANNLSRNINPKRGACMLQSFECNSGPMGLQPFSNEKDICEGPCSLSPSRKNRYKNQHPEEGSIENKSSTEQMNNGVSPADFVVSAVSGSLEEVNKSKLTPSERMTHALNVPAPTISSDAPFYNDCKPQDRKSYSKVLEQGEWKPQEENKQWILVQKKRLKNRFVSNKGKAVVESNVNFKAADIRIPLYIYNIAKDVTKDDIQNYVKNKTEVSVDLEKVIMKIPKDYDAYKVYVPKSKIAYFLRDEFWPEGVAFRRFIDFKGRHRSGQMPRTTFNQ